ncbi:hypothetical protein BvCmsSINP017_03582 [Escherichia coli]|nr:hypothetical protein G998_02051 [Escherichia coli UMEA 3889-1]VEC67947.1 Uncharacterised protein [Escherichia coli]GDG29811.1 hypothetical protein BvCmsKKP065_01271 [Escherichia coli]GDN16401.1 hypothetical protein BvCmsNSNP033_00534 [Escherichia coli]GDQ57866.1 hypothetical protein BvCmsNSP024_00925 [Escherichia coli]
MSIVLVMVSIVIYCQFDSTLGYPDLLDMS